MSCHSSDGRTHIQRHLKICDTPVCRLDELHRELRILTGKPPLEGSQLRGDTAVLSWTHTSTVTHLSTTSNIFTKMGPIELKLCICALVDIHITIVVFFVCQVARKTRSKKGPLSRWPMDAVSRLQPANAIASASQVAGVLSLNSSLFWTVTGCDRSKGGSQSKCGSMIVSPVWHQPLRCRPMPAHLSTNNRDHSLVISK